MGLLRWLRGTEETSAATLSAGLAELGGFFSPGQRKQTEHVEEQKRLRKDIHSAAGRPTIDLDQGVAVIRKPRDS